MTERLCECGCGEPVRNRFVKGHQRKRHCRDLEEFTEDPTTHCWVWKLHLNDGYGALEIRGKEHRAHRVFYEELVGPIPDGLTLDHLCRNRACVNPGHVEPVTWRENILRGEGQGARNARKTHCKHGHPFDQENTEWTLLGRRRCRACKRQADERYRARKSAVPQPTGGTNGT